MTTTKSKPEIDSLELSGLEPDNSRKTVRLSHNASNKKFGGRSLTIGRMMGLMAIVASLLVWGESWYTLFVFNFVLIYVCSEILVNHFPSSLASAMKRNCIRQDGSWSFRRERIEMANLNKLRWDIRITLLLILIPTMMLAILVDDTIIPLRIGFSGLASLRTDETETRENLVDEERAFEKWAPGNFLDRFLDVDVEAQKRIFWNFWPVALLGVFFWIAGCWITIKKSYVYQLKELSQRIRQRGSDYIIFDRARGL